ncbi:tetratricopeptide repeat protein [uncultured Novosphingobium sp.]|uniref:tetratricopeptide repeat protein n=1 Tax=uncultured Novosphingobium sp. TaxID=292277 RepID=UPI002589894B|nr:tetratricopeptide repeat protein [uncultured Novosphingobium sp.]
MSRVASPVLLREQALAAEKRGDGAGAARLFDQAMAAAPGDAALANSAAGSALRLGQTARALALYERATKLDPRSAEFVINHAIALGEAGEVSTALDRLAKVHTLAAREVRYWSVRAGLERQAADLDGAAQSYDRALALSPQHGLSLHGRARIALERGEDDAPGRYEQALGVDSGNPELWLGRAMALDAGGAAADARAIAQQVADALPGWPEAQKLRAQLAYAAGASETEFAAHYAVAIAKAPAQAADLYLSWSEALAGVARHDLAAQVAIRAGQAHPDDPRILLLAAATASRVGDCDRATGLIARLSEDTPAARLIAARHRLRLGEPDRAEALLERHLQDQPESIEGWALRSLAWRKLGDEREAWLHGQPGLINRVPVEEEAADFAGAVAVLDRLHDASAQPIGQSVRGGTQTRGALFARLEPELRQLQRAIQAALERHRAQLPPADEHHPLLRHRDAPWRIAGSWSVRLVASGQHEVHIHPQGMLSSALYMRLPETIDAVTKDGWLEIGGAPPDLGLDLAPTTLFEPREGTLALFPSTLYHGTRPFTGGHRLTVAFDAAPA